MLLEARFLRGLADQNSVGCSADAQSAAHTVATHHAGTGLLRLALEALPSTPKEQLRDKCLVLKQDAALLAQALFVTPPTTHTTTTPPTPTHHHNPTRACYPPPAPTLSLSCAGARGGAPHRRFERAALAELPRL